MKTMNTKTLLTLTLLFLLAGSTLQAQTPHAWKVTVTTNLVNDAVVTDTSLTAAQHSNPNSPAPVLTLRKTGSNLFVFVDAQSALNWKMLQVLGRTLVGVEGWMRWDSAPVEKHIFMRVNSGTAGYVLRQELFLEKLKTAKKLVVELPVVGADSEVAVFLLPSDKPLP